MRARTIICRLVWGIVVLATLVAFFYAEEDWRGAHALRSAEATYQQQGGSLNYADFIPPPIPDDQNLAALPVFDQTPDPKWEGALHPFALDKALRLKENLPPLPRTGNWQQGKRPDLKQIRAEVATLYATTCKGAPAPASSLAQFDAVFPIVDQLKNASATRSKCRFDFDYASSLMATRSLTLLTDQIRLAQIVALHAILALNESRPDVALGDLRTAFLLRSGAARDPSIVANLVSIGIGAISETVVADGLALREWDDPQLAQLEDELAKVDYLGESHFALQGELAAQMHDLPIIRSNFVYRSYLMRLSKDSENHQPLRFVFPWPVGWTNGGAARLIDFDRELQEVIDLKNRRVYPGRIQEMAQQRDHLFLHGRYMLPWDLFFVEMSTGGTTVPGKEARGQAWIDHSVIACALERYRLAHGNYPISLEALCPTYLGAIPHDFMNGASYHYRIQGDGSYLLYSVGWNGRDDGGTLVYLKGYHPTPSIDYEEGDWVWFGPK